MWQFVYSNAAPVDVFVNPPFPAQPEEGDLGRLLQAIECGAPIRVGMLRSGTIRYSVFTTEIAAFLIEMVEPDEESSGIGRDIRELREVASLGPAKTTLLLCGVIAEALLLERHPDKTDRGPGLAQLVAQARSQKLFGKDTLSHLDTLVQYRDLIHPRAAVRNRIEPNESRVESALTALRLLWTEINDRDVRFK